MNSIRLEVVANRPLLEKTYVVYEEESREGFIVDPGGSSIPVLNIVEKNRIRPVFILYTHLHLDHIAGGFELASQLSVPSYAHRDDLFLFDGIEQLAMFLKYPPVTRPSIEGFFVDGDQFEVGNTPVKVLHTPGHTPGGCSFVVEENVFSGDTLFKESVGRFDLPGGNEEVLLRSIREKLFNLPDNFVVYPGHGPDTTIGHERKSNPFVGLSSKGC